MSQKNVNSLDELIALLKNPPVEYRPMPQWSWNGELNEEHIRQRLREFADKGMGGMFAHARTNFATGYISDRFFELWDFAAREAQRLGMQFQIYDEFCCPSGNAAGQVVAERPHLARQELGVTVWTGVGPRPNGEPLAYLRLENGSPVKVANWDGATLDRPVCALVLRRVSGKAGFGGMPDNDLLRREATDAFIACTHEGYARKSKDLFGSAVRFMFSDEPYLSGHGGGLPMSRDLMREFHADHGYELADRLQALCFTQEGSEAVRFDYFLTINRLFNQNFMRPMAEWCERNDLLFTGHLMEHEWPSPISHPDAMASMRWMHAPGNDLLGFQFESTTLEKNGLYLLNLKELASLTNQLGREWTMVESCGGQGYHAAYELFKPCEDWLLCHGVNVIDPHLSHETLAGYSKYDWPQTLSEHSPWWKYYRHHADHVARANAVLSQGREHNRVLVLHPTTTAWMYYEHPTYNTVLPSRRQPGADKMEFIRKSQVDLLVALTGEQVDYDLGDEFLMEEFGKAEGGKLRVGERVYEIVVIPPAMENWTEATLKLMGDYLAAGGRVLAMTVPTKVNGRASAAPQDLASKYPRQLIQGEKTSALLRVLRSVVPPYLTAPGGSSLPAGLSWRRAATANGDAVWFFANPWAQEIVTDVRLPGAAAISLDTASATAEEVARGSGGHVAVKLMLPSRAHALLYVPAQPVAEVPPHRPRTAAAAVALSEPAITRRDENILTIDYCDVETTRGKLVDVATIHADARNWTWQGFDGSPWRGGYQFKRTIIDRPVAEGSGFAVQYRFTIHGNVPMQSLRIGLERPWVYQSITLNGRPLTAPEAWFDEAMRAFAIGGVARAGENVLRMECRPMHMLAQIMPVYLLGDFAALPASRGFEVAAREALRLGSWAIQGLSFYPGAVRYTFSFTLDSTAEALEVQLGEWAGAVADIHVDGSSRGVIMHPPYRLEVPGPFAAGQHEVAIDIVGNMKNMMGPHHAEGLPGPWTWDRCPERQPAGRDYRFVRTGLMTAPLVRIMR